MEQILYLHTFDLDYGFDSNEASFYDDKELNEVYFDGDFTYFMYSYEKEVPSVFAEQMYEILEKEIKKIQLEKDRAISYIKQGQEKCDQFIKNDVNFDR